VVVEGDSSRTDRSWGNL